MEFIGSVVVMWDVADPTIMRLVHDFSFKDSGGKLWTAPKGFATDGASIPGFLWSVIGSPFTGHYRLAAVIHDYYCIARSEPWQAVHKMFYEACLLGGCTRTQAKVLYSAVYGFGPRWDSDTGEYQSRVVSNMSFNPEEWENLTFEEIQTRFS